MSLATTTVVVTALCLCVVVVSTNNNLELYDDYVLLASDVQDWNRASSVFIIFGGNDKSLTAITLMLHLQREFSSKLVLSLTANYTEILDKYKGYYNRILCPLIVVLLSSEEDVMSFRDTTQAYDMSDPKWLIIFMNSTISFCKKPKDNIFNVKFDTNMLVKCYGDSNIREWYSVHGDEIITYDLALWDPVMRFRLKTNQTFYERRKSIGGKFLRIATVMESPFVLSQSHIVKKGLFEQIVDEVSKSLNFTYEVIYKETSYGIRDPETNRWSGVMGRIVNGEADIGVAEMTMTVERIQAVDFTVPLILSRNKLYMQPPGGSVVHWSSYSRAFDYKIWIVLGIVQAISVILITIIRLNIERKALPPGHISENYLTVWGTFCQQGLSDFPTATPLRIAYFSLLMSSVIILATYSACLISYLTLTIPSLPFNDLEGFVKIGTYKLLTYLGSSDYNMFLCATDPIMVKMKHLMKDKADLPKTVMGGFRRACEQKKVAFHATEAVKEQLNVWLACDLVSIDTGRFDSLGMVLTKGNPYTGVINYQLQKFKDCGIMSRLKRKYSMNVASGSKYRPVSLRGIVPLIVVLLVGSVIGAIVFFMEIIVFRVNRAYVRKRKNDKKIDIFKSLMIYKKYVRKRKKKFFQRKKVKNVLLNCRMTSMKKNKECSFVL